MLKIRRLFVHLMILIMFRVEGSLQFSYGNCHINVEQNVLMIILVLKSQNLCRNFTFEKKRSKTVSDLLHGREIYFFLLACILIQSMRYFFIFFITAIHNVILQFINLNLRYLTHLFESSAVRGFNIEESNKSSFLTSVCKNFLLLHFCYMFQFVF